MDWNNISVGFVIVGVLGLEKFVEFIVRYFNKAYKFKKGKEDDKEMLRRHDTEIKEVKETVNKMLDIITKQEEESKKTDCAILRNMIIETFKSCKVKGGKLSPLEYENLNEMFDRYFARGGNHLISKLYQEFQGWDVSLDESELISR